MKFQRLIPQLLVCLLAVIPIVVEAQQLTCYECWFDGDWSNRVSKSLSGYEADIDVGIPTQHLSDGLHTLYLRLKQSGGEYNYSPVTSTVFFKHNVSEGNQIEYWFDDNYEDHAYMALPEAATEDLVDITLNLQDDTQFPIGLHKLNLRVSTKGKSLNSVYSAWVLKLFSGDTDIIEYWVDGDFDNKKTISGRVSSSGNYVVFTDPFDLNGLTAGLHRIYYRTASSNGSSYSAVSMATVFNHNVSEGNKIEYWFDDNYENHAYMALPEAATEDLVDIAFNLQDDIQFPIGLHKLNFRVSTEGKSLNSVYSAWVLKSSSGNADIIEYWVDGDFDNKKTISGRVSSLGNYVVFADPFDLSGLAAGLHRVYYRSTSNNGSAYSAVNIATVVVGAGETPTLEYWIDNDRKHIGTLSGHEASTGGNGTIFNHTLDLGSVSEGIHRLHYRGINSNGVNKTAISSTPIMVKSRYNVDPADVKMKAFTIAVDNEEPVNVNVNRDDELILNPYTLNVRDLNPGNHTLKAHFWNTANAGVALEQNFTVNSIETPTITLTAQENDGRVTLKFNSIPNDVKWAILRTDANGVKVKIDGKTESCYPSEITSVDNPPAGSYIYKARGCYIDADGTKKNVNSNEVTVAVTSTSTPNDLFGKIEGRVRVGGAPLWGERWTITFSDNYTLETDGYGSYYRDKIPVGTVLEITAQSWDYICDPITITVKEGTNSVYHKGVFNEELVRSRYTSDLEFDSYLEFEPRLHMKFKVRNKTRLPWRGKLCIVTGRKDYVDNPPKNPFEQNDLTSDAQVLAGSVAPFAVNEYLQYDYSDELYLPSGESKEVFITHHIPLTSPPSYEDELYYFFVESIDEYGTKLVAVNEDYNIKENPLVQLVNNGQYDAERQGEEDVESCIALVMGMCSSVNELDGKLGDMSRCMEEMQQTLGYTLEYYLLADKIEHATNYTQILEDIPEWHFYQILYQEDRRFLGMVNSVRDKIAKEVRACKNTLKYLKDVKNCIDKVKEYDQWQGMTDLERAGAIAGKIIDLAEKKVPFASILKTYLDVTKTTIHNINGLAEKWYANHDYDTYYNRQGTYAGSDFTFDIKVKKKRWISSSFDAKDVKNRIYSVEIKCIGHIAGNAPLECTATYTPEVVDGKVRLQRVNITGDAPSSGGIVPIEDMWMTIRWSNGRVSYVPIRNSQGMQGNGVKHDKNHYTITFQSATNDEEHMADIISLDD